ncbi:MAG: hypothetical protein KIG98_02425 [Comamonas sp.]|nr:hypothetical protein [Comamonas sp.]
MNTVSHAMASAQPFSGAAPMSQAASTAATPSPSLPIQSAAAHTVPAMALNSTTPDPIRLHMQALNSLSRCKAMLLANEPMYLFAQQWLAQAQQAIADLQAIDQPHSTEG